MKKNNLNNFVLPLMSSDSSSCLTNQNIEDTDVEWVSYKLSSLLLKPGMHLLNSIPNLKSYVGWNKNIVLNAANLEMDSKKRFVIYSEFDGSKQFYLEREILDLILKLDVQKVILPDKLMIDRHDFILENKTIFLSVNDYLANIDFYKDKCSYGVYLNFDNNDKHQLLSFVKDFETIPKYIFGDLSLDVILSLVNVDDLYFESTRPSIDAYNGFVYGLLEGIDLVDESSRFKFIPINDSCSCQACLESHTVAYLHHLYQHTPLLCQRLLVLHNVFYVGHLRQA